MKQYFLRGDLIMKKIPSLNGKLKKERVNVGRFRSMRMQTLVSMKQIRFYFMQINATLPLYTIDEML